MFYFCDWEPLGGLEFSNVKGLPSPTDEGIFNLFNWKHDEVLVGVVARKSIMTTHRLHCIFLGGISC